MPIAAERALRVEAERKFPGDKRRQDAYVYGALRRMGWKPKREVPEHRRLTEQWHQHAS